MCSNDDQRIRNDAKTTICTRFWTNLANFTTMHNEKRLLCEFKLRRDRPLSHLSGKVKIPHLQPQYVSQGHVLCQSRWRAGVGAGPFRSSRRQKNSKENFGCVCINTCLCGNLAN